MGKSARSAVACVCLALGLSLGGVYAQLRYQTGTVVADAPIFVAPGAQQPLRVAASGTVLEILQTQGTWLNVRFQDPQFGPRVGYVEAKLVRQSAPAGSTVPMDLSVRPTNAPEPTAVSTRSVAAQSQQTTAAPVQPAPVANVARPVGGGGQPRVYIDASETLDGSNAHDKAKQVDFGTALTAALVKKGVPVTVVTDPTKADWTIKSVSSQREDSTGTKVAKLAFAGAFAGGFTTFEGTVQVIDNVTTGVLYAYNVKKGNFQSAAEAFAKHFKGDYLDKH